MNPTPLFFADTYQTSGDFPVPDTLTRPAVNPARFSWRDVRPSLGFYAPLAWIVLKAGIQAGRGLYDGQAWAQSSEQTVRALERTGCHIEVTGLEHFHHIEGPCVFIGNHMSTLETFLLPSMIQPWKDVTFVVKQSLLKYPFFGAVLGSRDPLVVGRLNPREDLVAVLEGGAKRLAEGRSIIVFPQSTRTPNFDPAQFNTIGIKLAKRAGVPVVPFALKTDAWSNGALFKDFGPIYPERTIHFAFSSPIQIATHGKEEHRYISDYIQSRLADWNISSGIKISCKASE